MKWLKENGCPFEDDTIDWVKDGNLDIVQWLKDNGCPH